MQKTRNIILLTASLAVILWGVACSIFGNSTLNTTNSTSPSVTPVSTTGALKGESDMEIRLDFHPFKSSTSFFLFLRSDGRARVMQYDRSQLTVKASYEGKASKESVTGLLSRIQDPDFQEALRNKDFTGSGLSQGDQFYLSLNSKGQATKDVFGFVLDTNSTMQGQIKDMLGLRKQLPEIPLADGYIVSEAITKDRFDKLRNQGKVRFRLVSELPSNLQSFVSLAIERPRDFHALNKEQYEHLLLWSAEISELFIIANNSGYQLTLFKSAK